MSPEGSTITFRRGVPIELVGSHRKLERFARKLRSDLAQGREFGCLITTDAELRRLNRDFRGRDEPTDILSFPAAGPKPASGPKAYLGDLAISLPRARAQARAFGHEITEEIQILMLHGVLHLLGMDHEADGGRMATAERRWRNRLKLPNGLIERAKGISQR